jgi:vacuole morphology and inheritance protein 14
VKFFLSHNCNYYCRKLNLINPKVEGVTPPKFKFYLEELEKPRVSQEMITKLCDLCRKSFKMEAIQIYQRNVDNLEFYCQVCDDLKLKTIKSSSCVDCKEEF